MITTIKSKQINNLFMLIMHEHMYSMYTCIESTCYYDISNNIRQQVEFINPINKHSIEHILLLFIAQKV